eukprot:jgi/Pico_ML_1/50933/g2048.t1
MSALKVSKRDRDAIVAALDEIDSVVRRLKEQLEYEGPAVGGKRKGPYASWTPEEEELLLEKYQECDGAWDRIYEYFKDSDKLKSQVRSKYFRLVRRKMRDMN